MTHNPVTSTPQPPFGQLHMMEHGCHHLPIADANRAPSVGLVSSKDALNLRPSVAERASCAAREITVIFLTPAEGATAIKKRTPRGAFFHHLPHRRGNRHSGQLAQRTGGFGQQVAEGDTALLIHAFHFSHTLAMLASPRPVPFRAFLAKPSRTRSTSLVGRRHQGRVLLRSAMPQYF